MLNLRIIKLIKEKFRNINSINGPRIDCYSNIDYNPCGFVIREYSFNTNFIKKEKNKREEGDNLFNKWIKNRNIPVQLKQIIQALEPQVKELILTNLTVKNNQTPFSFNEYQKQYKKEKRANSPKSIIKQASIANLYSNFYHLGVQTEKDEKEKAINANANANSNIHSTTNSNSIATNYDNNSTFIDKNLIKFYHPYTNLPMHISDIYFIQFLNYEFKNQEHYNLLLSKLNNEEKDELLILFLTEDSPKLHIFSWTMSKKYLSHSK